VNALFTFLTVIVFCNAISTTCSHIGCYQLYIVLAFTAKLESSVVDIARSGAVWKYPFRDIWTIPSIRRLLALLNVTWVSGGTT
jgi:hypothetical protein